MCQRVLLATLASFDILHKPLTMGPCPSLLAKTIWSASFAFRLQSSSARPIFSLSSERLFA